MFANVNLRICKTIGWVIVLYCALILVQLVNGHEHVDRPYLNPYPEWFDYRERQRKPHVSEDWRYGKEVHQFWVRSWRAYSKRDYEGAIEKLKALLSRDLTREQIDEVHYAMGFNYRLLAIEAHFDNDLDAKIRYLKAAASIERYPPVVTIDYFQIAQVYRRLENWNQCAQYGERAFTVELKWIKYAYIKTLIVAECQFRDDNLARAKYWVDVALKMHEEWGEPILDEQQWVIDSVNSAVNSPEVSDP